MRNIMILSTSLLLVLFSGCVAIPVLEGNGSQVLKSESEFGVLTAQPDVYEGRAIKLAGRIVGVESTTNGTIVNAEWLPYPEVEYQGPNDLGKVKDGTFTIFYPGTLDREGRQYGNKFLVVGKIGSPQSGGAQVTPSIMARCLHVWKTGNDAIETEPDAEFIGDPVTEETYCSDT